MMTTVTRSKLTIAAEIAAVGAFVIAVLAIVVTVFFDTGIRLPWSSDGQSLSTPVTSPAATSTKASQTESASQSTNTSQPTTSSRSQPPVNENQQSEPTPVSRDWLGINWAATKEFGDGAGLWTVVLFALIALVAMRAILWVLYDRFVPVSVLGEFLTGVIPMGAIGYLYLWTFWSNISDLGVAFFTLGAIVTTVYSCLQA